NCRVAFGFRSERARDAQARRAVEDRVAAAVPPGMRIAAAWSWRLLVVAGLVALVVFLVIELRYIVVPLMIAMLLSALLVPFSNWLQRHRWPKWAAVAVSEVGVLAVIGGLIWLTYITVRSGAPAPVEQTRARGAGLAAWLFASPLHLSEAASQGWLDASVARLQEDSSTLWSGALSVGTSVGHVLAGLLLVLFATLFILIDGRGIWHWVV